MIRVVRRNIVPEIKEMIDVDGVTLGVYVEADELLANNLAQLVRRFNWPGCHYSMVVKVRVTKPSIFSRA